jgi:dUTP pyrophosphatase
MFSFFICIPNFFLFTILVLPSLSLPSLSLLTFSPILSQSPNFLPKSAHFATTITPNPPSSPSTTPTPPIFHVKKLSEHAVIPSRGSNGAAGYDLHAAYDAVVPKRGKALVKTDLAMIIDPSVYGRIAPRSGLAWKHSIDVGAGVIDSDYRGNIGIVLFNHGDDDFIIGKGDRIAQLIFEKIQMVEFAEVDELEETNRANGGFGSTGQ